MRINCSQMLTDLVIHITARGQHYRRIDLQLNSRRVAHDQHHADHLRPPGTFRQHRLVGIRAVGHCAQVAIRVVQANLANPPASDLLGNDLLGDDLAGIGWINKETVQRCTAVFSNQGGLAAVGQWRTAVAIADAHLGQLQRRAQRSGIGQLGLTNCGQDGKVGLTHSDELQG